MSLTSLPKNKIKIENIKNLFLVFCFAQWKLDSVFKKHLSNNHTGGTHVLENKR